VRLIIEARLGQFEAGDVCKHRHKVSDQLIPVAHGADGQPTGVQFAVLSTVGNLALPMTLGRQLVPHRGVKRAVMQARGEEAGCLAEGFGFAVASDFAEGAVDGADVLPGVGDQHAFGGTLEYRRGLLQFFLHQLTFGDVAGDGQHAVFPGDRQRATGHFTHPNFTVATAYVADEITHKAISLHQFQHVFAFVEIDPDAQFQG